jgi:diguanylate cyclase (GGDEF)-like protein
MDFQKLADSLGAMSSVISIEKKPDGGYGTIRIVAGNEAYTHSVDDLTEAGGDVIREEFVPNSEYTKYITKDLNFENAVYSSAIEKKVIHSYVRPDRFDVWLNMVFMPINYEDENLAYCTYTMEFNFEPDSSNVNNVDGSIASEVLETCIKIRGAKDFRKVMQDVIKDIRRICQSECCSILLIDDYEKICSLLCEDMAEDSKVGTITDFFSDDLYDMVRSWEETVIFGSNCLIAKDAQAMEVVKERHPTWYKSLEEANIRNIILYPLKTRDTLLGYMYAMNFDGAKSEMIKQALEVTIFILASEIDSFLLVDRLKILSSRDMLTGVLNRNEMNNLVDKFCRGIAGAGESVGVIFADLNGLKRVNDEFGHAAGDKLLKNAAKALQEVFDDEHIFRAGGDEFSIIYSGATEEEMAGKIEKLREVSSKYDKVIFAIGGCVQKDCRDVRTALRVADERMYEDKNAYYEKNPELRRGAYKDNFYYNTQGSN